MQRLYHNVKLKVENDDVQMGLNIEIVPRPSLDVSLDSFRSGSSFEGLQVQLFLFYVGKINYKNCVKSPQSQYML